MYRDFDIMQMWQKVERELQRAQKKFPLPEASIVALTEEVGELAQAALNKSWTKEVREEAIQVAAMAFRVAIEGDPSLLIYRKQRKIKEDMPKRCPYKGCSEPYRNTPPCALCYE